MLRGWPATPPAEAVRQRGGYCKHGSGWPIMRSKQSKTPATTGSDGESGS